MKGQSTFEFVIAALLFFGIVIYTLNHVNTAVWVFQNDHYANYLESTAMKIDELLVANGGVIKSGRFFSIGLANEWLVLNSSKMKLLNDTCRTNYDGVMRLLGVDTIKHGAEIEIHELGNETLIVDCHKPSGKINRASVPHAIMKRFALSEDGKILVVEAMAW